MREIDSFQYGPTSEFWVDQASFFLFPVGWASLNNYILEAKNEYKKHTQRIADAILSGTEPPYAPTDVVPEQLAEWKRVPVSSFPFFIKKYSSMPRQNGKRE